MVCANPSLLADPEHFILLQLVVGQLMSWLAIIAQSRVDAPGCRLEASLRASERDGNGRKRRSKIRHVTAFQGQSTEETK